MPVPDPDLSTRPHTLSITCDMRAPPDMIYDAWTRGWERWFAYPGTASVWPEIGTAFFFETRHEGTRHPHYGRFLHLAPAKRVQLTWVTGAGGTEGAETLLTVDLTALDDGGTGLTLTHAGFPNAQAAARHEQAWPQILTHLDQVLAPTSENDASGV